MVGFDVLQHNPRLIDRVAQYPTRLNASEGTAGAPAVRTVEHADHEIYIRVLFKPGRVSRLARVDHQGFLPPAKTRINIFQCSVGFMPALAIRTTLATEAAATYKGPRVVGPPVEEKNLNRRRTSAHTP